MYRFRTAFVFLALLVLLAPLAAKAEPKPLVTTNIIDDFLFNVRTEAGAPVTDATPNSERLREAVQGNPVLAPDGHWVTAGEWRKATGTATAKCLNNGTLFIFTLQNLIPRGVYSMWLFSLKGQMPPSDFGAMTLTGFRANHAGRATIALVVPPGPLSVRGNATQCLLDNFQVSLIGNYHLDGQTHGGIPGLPGTNAEQFSFTIANF